MKQLRLRYKINGTIFITFAFIALVFSAIHLPFQQKRFQTVMEKVEILLHTLVERDKKPLANEIFEGRVRPISMRLQEMRKVKGILAISVFDDAGKLLVSEGPPPVSSQLSEAEQEAAARNVQSRKKNCHGQSTFTYLQEIRMIGERIGFIRLDYSLADVDREQHLSFVIFGGLLISILVIMLISLNLILKKTIINPIIFLRDAMRQIRAGELGGQVNIESRDEIGDLSKTFNEMSSDLAESYQKLSDSHRQIETWNVELNQAQENLHEINEDLDQRVRDRTVELTRANAEILSLNDQLEATLIRSEKMAILGQIISGVAHEIKTPLGAIRASIDNISGSLPQILEELPALFQSLSEDLQRDFSLLLERTARRKTDLTARQERKLKRALTAVLEDRDIENADDIADTLTDMGIHDDTEALLPLFRSSETDLILQTAYNLSGLQRNSQNIATATDQASKIIFALKSYAHYDHTESLVEADLTEGIETVLTLCHNQLKYGVEVIRNYEELSPVLCYPDELNQVWTNLIHNAAQAMDGKGTLEIDVRQRDDRAVVTVTDSGKGVPDEVKERIFEPFFTTKPAGEGSGLGLDIVKKIIDKHRGRIEVESELGRTSFKVLIPIGR